MSEGEPQAWVMRILADLRTFSADLLETGLAPSDQACATPHDGSPLRSTLRWVDLVCRRLPDLLKDLDGDESFLVSEMVPSPVPRHALRTNRPDDYALHGGHLLPRRWLRPEPSPGLRLEPLRWVVWFTGQLQEELALHRARLEKASLVRAGQTIHAQEDISKLDALKKSVVSAEHRLDQCLATMYHRAGRTFTGSPRLPHPFPRSSLWQGFRREIQHHAKTATQQTASWLQTLEAQVVTMAELPYLYQRWCGLQILQAVQRMGWQTEDDAIGALLFGGSIRLFQAMSRLELWVEPRLAAPQAERIGWRSSARAEELTPDFLFVCGLPGQRDAFVLDATLSRGEDQRADRNQIASEKGRYRKLLVGVDPVWIAGIAAVRKPLRSWAMAPIRSRACFLGDDREGWTGIIPMNAHSDDFSGLEAWLGDVLAHAERSRPAGY